MSKATRAIANDEYDAIERAVLETPRGRWFLEEYARRHKAADTDEVIGAIERLTDLTRETAAGVRFGFLYHEMRDMHRTITEARAAMAAVKPGSRSDRDAAHQDLAAIAETAERAAGDIVTAAERLQEIAETLRASGADNDICDEIETHATGIFMASAYQEMTGKRIATIATVLSALEARVSRIAIMWEEEAAR